MKTLKDLIRQITYSIVCKQNVPSPQIAQELCNDLLQKSMYELWEGLACALDPSESKKTPLAFRIADRLIIPYFVKKTVSREEKTELCATWLQKVLECKELLPFSSGALDLDDYDSIVGERVEVEQEEVVRNFFFALLLSKIEKNHPLVHFLGSSTAFFELFLDHARGQLKLRLQQVCDTRQSAPRQDTQRRSTASKTMAQINTMDKIVQEGMLIDRYRILSKLGVGGMGIVFKAEDVELKRHVAIKFILNTKGGSRAMKRFYRELEISAALSHPNIVRVYSIGTHQECPYMVMEYVDGECLMKYFVENACSLKEQVRMLAKVADALHYAHKKNIIHRDIKPSNIMVRKSGDPVLMDFGIAKITEVTDCSLTRSGEIVGTPQYMSPEQAEGLKKEIGPETDVYSLGAVLYQFLTGLPPIEGETLMERIHFIISKSPKPPREVSPDVPEELEKICMRALEKQKKNRYSTTKDFANDIYRFLKGKKTLSKKYYQYRKVWHFMSVFSLSLLLVLVLLSAWHFNLGKSTNFERDLKYREACRQFLDGKAKWEKKREGSLLSISNALKSLEGIKEKSEEIRGKIGEIRSFLANLRIGPEHIDSYYEANQKYLQGKFHENLEESYLLLSSALEIYESLRSVPISMTLERKTKDIQDILNLKELTDAYLSTGNRENLENLLKRLSVSSSQENRAFGKIAFFSPIVPGLMTFLFKNKIAMLVSLSKKAYWCNLAEGAEHCFERLESYRLPDPVKWEISYYRGLIRLKNGHFQEARSRFEKILGEHGALQGEEALHYCASILEYPDSPISEKDRKIVEDFLARENASTPLYKETKARYLVKSIGESSRKEEIAKEIVTLVGESSDDHLLKAELYYIRGKANTTLGNYPEAFDDFSMALECEPSNFSPFVAMVECIGKYAQVDRLQNYQEFIVNHTNQSISMQVSLFGNKFEELHRYYLSKQFDLSTGIPFSAKNFDAFYEKLWDGSLPSRQIAEKVILKMIPYEDVLKALEEKKGASTRGQKIEALCKEIREQHVFQRLFLALSRIPYEGKILNLDFFSPERHVHLLQSVLTDPKKSVYLRFLAARVLVHLPSEKIRRHVAEHLRQSSDIVMKILIARAFRDIRYNALLVDYETTRDLYDRHFSSRSSLERTFLKDAEQDEFVQVALSEILVIERSCDMKILFTLASHGSDRVKSSAFSRLAMIATWLQAYPGLLSDEIVKDWLQKLLTSRSLEVQSKVIAFLGTCLSPANNDSFQWLKILRQVNPRFPSVLLKNLEEIPVPVLYFWREALPQFSDFPSAEKEKILQQTRALWQSPSFLIRSHALMTSAAFLDRKVLDKSLSNRPFFEIMTFLIGVMSSTNLRECLFLIPQLLQFQSHPDQRVRGALIYMITYFLYQAHEESMKTYIAGLVKKSILESIECDHSFLSLAAIIGSAYFGQNDPKIMRSLNKVRKESLSFNFRGVALGALLHIAYVNQMKESEKLHAWAAERKTDPEEEYALRMGGAWGYFLFFHQKLHISRDVLRLVNWAPESIAQMARDTARRRATDPKNREGNIDSLEKAVSLLEPLVSSVSSREYARLFEDYVHFLSILYETSGEHEKAIECLSKARQKLKWKESSLSWALTNLCLKKQRYEEAKETIERALRQEIPTGKNMEEMKERLYYRSQLIRSRENIYLETDPMKADEANLLLQYLLAPQQPYSLFAIGKYFFCKKEYEASCIILENAFLHLPDNGEVSILLARSYAHLTKTNPERYHFYLSRIVYFLNKSAKFRSLPPSLQALGSWPEFDEKLTSFPGIQEIFIRSKKKYREE